MKLVQFLDEEDRILAEPMLEMANLHPDDTGLHRVIWIGEVGGQHGPRIKVSNLKGKYSKSDNFVISVNKDPIVLTPKSMKISQDELDNILDWVKLNYSELMELWNAFESGSGSITKLLTKLKKI